MKTLHNYLILYDAECPMCNLYTRAFTKSGMLDPTGRAPYQTALDPNHPAINSPTLNPNHPACPLIDRRRAVNEIALINTETGEVRYGIDSLFKVIGHSFPIFRPLFSWTPFIWLMRKAYAFISYNRKVIIPPPTTLPPTNAATPQPTSSATPDPATSASTLQPTFSLKHRLAYLLFTLLIAAAILTRYAHLLTGILPVGTPWREYLICSGQILYQGMVVSIIAPAKRWEYLGNMMTISLAGSLVLLPAIALAALTDLSPFAATAWFLLVAAVMLLEHIRRTRLLGLDWTLTISWVAYRLFVLVFIMIVA